MTARVVGVALTIVAALPHILTTLRLESSALKLVPLSVNASPPAKEEVERVDVVRVDVVRVDSGITTFASFAGMEGYPCLEFSS